MYRDFARSNGQSVRHEVREGVVATCRCVDGAKKKEFQFNFSGAYNVEGHTQPFPYRSAGAACSGTRWLLKCFISKHRNEANLKTLTLRRVHNCDRELNALLEVGIEAIWCSTRAVSSEEGARLREAGLRD